MPLVVDNQTCALREYLSAYSTLWMLKHALELRLAGLSARREVSKLLVGVPGEDFEASIV